MTIERAAIVCKERGFQGVVLTDHMDIDTPTGEDRFMFDPGEQQLMCDKISRKYGVELLKGIELGLQPNTVEKSRERLKDYKFDMVIMSVHFVLGLDPYHQPHFYEGKDHIKAYGEYLSTILQCMSDYGDFDSLGHYDYITRYSPYKERVIRYRDFPDLMDSILTYLAQNGKALEINTNTYRSRYRGAATPDPDLFRRFKELGGEFVSLGSDSHTEERICENFDFFADFLSNCGFRYQTMFRGRKASLTAI